MTLQEHMLMEKEDLKQRSLTLKKNCTMRQKEH